jgi:hypothetical protein
VKTGWRPTESRAIAAFRSTWVKRRKLLPLSAVSLLFALPVTAHHSGAMFDDAKSMTLFGTVKAFQWTNPHCWIQLAVPGEAGTVEWSVEMGAPIELFRGGWRPGTLQAGDRIAVTIHPMRNGATGGLYVSATLGGDCSGRRAPADLCRPS